MPTPLRGSSEAGSVAASEALFSEEEKSIHLRRIDADVAEHIARSSRTRYLGRSLRSPLTGQVTMTNAEFSKNWVLTDLWTRESISGNISDIVKDPFIFKAKALALRTWMWHSIYRDANQKAKLGEKVHMGLFEALEARINDHDPVNFSPLLVLVPMTLLTTLSMDVLVIFLAAPLLLGCYAIDCACNWYKWYWAARHFSLPIRIAYMAAVILSMGMQTAITGMQVLGYLLAIGMILVDFAFGDFKQLLGRRVGDYYEIIRPLRNEVFVCRWHGTPRRNPLYRLPERIVGMGVMEQRSEWRHVMLIAVIQGIICELIPIEKEDETWWKDRLFEARKEGKQELILPFCGCDVFDNYYVDLGRIEMDNMVLKAKEDKLLRAGIVEETAVQDFDD